MDQQRVATHPLCFQGCPIDIDWVWMGQRVAPTDGLDSLRMPLRHRPGATFTGYPEPVAMGDGRPR